MQPDLSSQYFRFNAPAGERQRSALIERMLARADARASASDWRAEAFNAIALPGTLMPSIAGAAVCADLGAVDAVWACIATPVHYVAEMTTVRLPEDGILSLTPAAAETLAADFNRVWKGAGIYLMAGRSAQLFCLFDRALEVTTREPHEVLGQPIEEYLPVGKDAAPLRRLISETEMWLFEHGVNSARGKSGLPVVNGLWFWGGGATLAALPKLTGWVGGDDVFFNAFGARPEAGVGSGVVAAVGAPGSDQWRDAEMRWLRPAIAQLRAGSLSRVEISADHCRFILTSRGLKRFWRRRKPWWEFLA
jgi:hypothetical protein